MQPGHEDGWQPRVEVGEATGARGQRYSVAVEGGTVKLAFPCDSHAPFEQELGVAGAQRLAAYLLAASQIAQVANP